MTPFSASDAALEGFNLIRRRWRVILGWAGFNLLTLVMLVVLTVVLSFVTAAVTGGAKGAVQVVAALIVVLGELMVQASLAAGVFRIELRPEEPAFLYLRLGRDEIRLIVVWLIVLTGAWMVGWVAAMLGHAIGFGGVWIGVLAAILGVYLGLRFLLAAPISFAERRIDFVRSWRLSRGRVGPLLGMTALSFTLVGLLLVLLFFILGAIAFASAGLDGLSGLFGGADALKGHPGLYLLQFAVDVLLTPVLWALGMAPIASAYRAFTGTQGEPAQA